MTQSSPFCSVCKSAAVEIFFRLPDVPICANVLWDTPEDARRCPTGDIELVVCHSCGMITNVAFDPTRLSYNSRYENSLHFSPRFQEYAEKLAQRLIRDHGLDRKTVLEIGCGKGDFLSLLCRLGNNLGVGFDPSYVGGRVDSTVGKGFSVLADHFSEKYSELLCDLLCCRHTLEHVPEPTPFLSEIRRALGNRRVPVYFEVPNALFTLREGGVWDIIYEHCSYFSSSSLTRLFRLARFNVRQIRIDFGDQFLCADAETAIDASHESKSQEVAHDEVAKIVRDAQMFGQKFFTRVEYWRRKFSEVHQSGRRVVLWGAGSKGVTFLNAIGGEAIQYTVDLNSHKHGRFIPGTGQQVVPPVFLQEYGPDVILVMNPIYCDEIEHQIRTLGLNTEVLCERNDEHDICGLQLS